MTESFVNLGLGLVYGVRVSKMNRLNRESIESD